MPLNLPFYKTGKEIKEAIKGRINQLQARLSRQDKELDDFMHDTKKLRSYLIHSANPTFAAPQRLATLRDTEDISHEEKEHIDHLCKRIQELEQEIRRLRLITRHLDEVREFELSYNELVMYGFDETIE
jgi:predicted RNase H-like nuclease (RuvC/YqgF family)